MDGVPIAGCLGDQHAALLGEPMSPKRGFRMGKEAPSPERARQVMDDKGLQDWTRQIVRGFHGTMSGWKSKPGRALGVFPSRRDWRHFGNVVQGSAADRGRPKTRTAQDASCCSTRGQTMFGRRTAS